MSAAGTVAEALVRRLAQYGVRRFFGVPGGDCSLDLIEAGRRHGVEFVLTRTESAAAIMAAVTAELTGAPGVLMTTRGPGLANAVNGIAYATLDRAPLLVLADGHEPGLEHVSHQRFDQHALLRPLVRAGSDLSGGADPVAELDRLVAAASAEPPGPVHLALIGRYVRAPAPVDLPPLPAVPVPVPAAEEALAAARAVLSRARRPVIVAGLQALEGRAATALRRLAAAWGCPVLETYKAKGCIAAEDPRALGPFIAGAAEDAAMRAADAILLFGADPVEFPPQPWRYAAPAVELTRHAWGRAYLRPAAQVVGDLADMAERLTDAVAPGGWAAAEMAALRAGMRALATAAPQAGTSGIAPHALVEAVAAAVPEGTRIAVDAGAHMLPVMALWPARHPRDVLISRGLATMGSALPAAIGAALVEPERPVVAFTGDGGLMMCAAELATAAQLGCRILVVVFNDAGMSLIEVKQRRRQLPMHGMRYHRTDFAAVAEGFGCRGLPVGSPEALGRAVAQALEGDGPALLDVAIDREAYHPMVQALRG